MNDDADHSDAGDAPPADPDRPERSGPAAEDRSPPAGRPAASNSWLVLFLALAAGGSAAAALIALLFPEPVESAFGGARTAVLLALALGCPVALFGFFRVLRRIRRGVERPWGGWPFRQFFCSLVCGWVAAWTVSEPFDLVAAATAFALGMPLFAGAVALRLTLARPGLRRVGRAVDLTLFNLCLLVVALEVGLRGFATVRPSMLLMRPSSDIVENIERGRLPAGTVRFGYPVNSTGHYDDEFVPKVPGRTLVVCIGDSFSAGVVHHSLHFTTVAERNLDGVDVDNMGVPAIGTREYLHLAVTEALPLHPDLLVIDLFVGNDLTDPIPESDGMQTLRSWFARDSILVYQLPVRLARLRRERAAGLADLEDREHNGAEETVLRTPEEVRSRFPWIDDPTLEQPILGEHGFALIERSRFAQLRDVSLQDVDRHLRPLLEIRKAAGDTPVLVMVIPDRFQIEDKLWRSIRPPGATREDRMRGLRLTREWLKRAGFQTLDLVPALRAVRPLDDGERHLYHLGDTHFNARGNRVAGEALAKFLAPRIAARGKH